MLANGYTEEFARNLFRQIEGFGSYGFPESHAASFALLVYVSAWIKCHHPAIFLAALLNSQPMGFYGPAQLVADARAHDVEVRPVDVNLSDWETTIESRAEDQKLAVRLGFSMIKGLSSSAADTVVRARETGPFRTYGDFVGSNAAHERGPLSIGSRRRVRLAGTHAPAGPLEVTGRDPDRSHYSRDLPDDDPPPSLPPLSPPEDVVPGLPFPGAVAARPPTRISARILEPL